MPRCRDVGRTEQLPVGAISTRNAEIHHRDPRVGDAAGSPARSCAMKRMDRPSSAALTRRNRLTTCACTETSSAGHRFLGHEEEPGRRIQRTCDSHPLALAAGEFVRITVSEVRCQPDHAQCRRQQGRAARRVSARDDGSASVLWRRCARSSCEDQRRERILKTSCIFRADRPQRAAR